MTQPSYSAAVAAVFHTRPDEWIDAADLRAVGGPSWYARLANLRKSRGYLIQNRVTFRAKNPGGTDRSEYRWVTSGHDDRPLRAVVPVSAPQSARVIGKDGKSYRRQTHDRSSGAAAQRVELIRSLAAKGSTIVQIRAAVGITEAHVRLLCKKHQIDVPAEKVMSKSRRIDSTRVIEKTIEAAEMVTAGVKFIDWNSVDRASVPEWVISLRESRASLTRFLTRLEELL